MRREASSPGAARWLSQAVPAAAPQCAPMCGDVRQGAAESRIIKTKPPAARPVTAPARQDGRSDAKTTAVAALPHAEMCGDVRTGAADTLCGKTNPRARAPSAAHQPGGEPGRPPQRELTHRQIAAARLLALGRSGRAVAAEIGVNEHTITRWRRTPAFADEIERQHAQVLAEQVRLRRAESVDAYAAVAERLARKYGLGQ